MAFCTECGANASEGVKFCIECGKPLGGASQSVPAMAMAAAQPVASPQAQPVAQQMPPPVYPPPQSVAPPVAASRPVAAPPYAPVPVQAAATSTDAPPPKDSIYAVLSTGAYFVTCLLFSLPLVGWLICIIMAFAAKNLNRRNLAKAMLIFIAIGLVFSIIMYFVFQWAWTAMMEAVSEAAGGTVSSSMGIGDLLEILGNQ